MSEPTSLANCFLIAMPTLQDAFFSKSVVYLCEHSSDGAIGIAINKSLDITLETLLRHLDFKVVREQVANVPVLFGGPVGLDQGFVLHSPMSLVEGNNIEGLVLSVSKDLLRNIAENHGPEQFIVTLGCAAWEKGQLEAELKRNDWLVVPFNKEIVFTLPLEQRWQAAARSMGIEILQLSDYMGHA